MNETSGIVHVPDPRPIRKKEQTAVAMLDRLVFDVQAGHTAAVTCVAVSDSGDLVASGSEDHTVKLWDARSGRLLHSLDARSIEVAAVALNEAGDVLASGWSWDRAVKLCDARTGGLLPSFEGSEGHQLLRLITHCWVELG